MKRLDPKSDAACDLATGRYRIQHQDTAGLAAVTVPWMREAGWNPGLHDAESFFAADPRGFLVGEWDGRPIATVSAVRYDDTFGFIGCYIVQESFRGRGYGLALHEAARKHLEGCTQGGDGVLANVEKYKQIGRVFAHRNARYEGIKQVVDWTPPLPCREASSLPLSAIEELDRACFPAARPAFLKAWLGQAGAAALAVTAPGESGPLRGYGVIRPCFRGWKIGPLFARDPQTAESLFRGLVDRIPLGNPFVLDISESNPEALALVQRHGLTEVFATARMYTGPFPKIQQDWVYGITSFELG